VPKVHLPDGRVVHFPAGMPPEQMQAEVAKLSAVKDGVNPAMEQQLAAQAKRPAPDERDLPATPLSPAGLLRRGVTAAGSVIGQPLAEGMAQGARAALKLTPVVSLGADLLEDGAPVGGTIGGVLGGALSGGTAAIGGAAAGGAVGDAARRWFHGHPQDAGVSAGRGALEGGIQAGSMGLGAVVTPVARSMYRAALRPGTALVNAFGDVAERGLAERLPVSPASIPKAAGRTTASRAKALQMVEGSPERVTAGDVVPSLEEVVTKARNAEATGAVSEMPRLMDRARTIEQTFGHGQGVPLARAQELKEAAQDQATAAFNAADRGGRVSTFDDEAARDVAVGIQKAIEAKVPGVGPQNANTKELIGLLSALEKADARRLAGGSSLPTTIPSFLARSLGGAGTGSRAAIGLDRAARANSPAHAARMAEAVIQTLLQDDEQP
jgi:hypothetical protein